MAKKVPSRDRVLHSGSFNRSSVLDNSDVLHWGYIDILARMSKKRSRPIVLPTSLLPVNIRLPHRYLNLVLPKIEAANSMPTTADNSVLVAGLSPFLAKFILVHLRRVC